MFPHSGPRALPKPRTVSTAPSPTGLSGLRQGLWSRDTRPAAMSSAARPRLREKAAETTASSRMEDTVSRTP